MSLKSANKTDTNVYTLELSIDADTFAKANDKAFNREKGKIQVPGFRKGKAPKAFIEKYYGEGVFYEDALDIAFPEVYSDAVKESGIEPVDHPFDFDIKSIGKDGVELVCKVTVKPEVELGEYKGLKAEKETVAVTDEEVDEALNRKLEENARIIPVEDRVVENGDIVTIDFEGFNDGVAFDGGKAEGYELEIGSGQFIPGFEEQIIGHNIDEEFDVNVTFPEEYGEKSLAGKPAVFKVKLHEIKYKELPKSDDDFAKDVSEFDTIAEYKDDLKKSILDNKQKNADRAFENKILDMVADLVNAEIPDAMVEHAIDDAANEFNYRLQMQGMNLDTYLQYTGMTMEAFRDSYKDKALKDVKIMLALEKIAELEGIEVTEDDLSAEYQKFADAYQMKIEDIKKAVSEDTVKGDIANRKAIDAVVSAAKVKKPAAKRTTKKKAAAETEAKPAEEEAKTEE